MISRLSYTSQILVTLKHPRISWTYFYFVRNNLQTPHSLLTKVPFLDIINSLKYQAAIFMRDSDRQPLLISAEPRASAGWAENLLQVAWSCLTVGPELDENQQRNYQACSE
jgi:hypothetical protein